MSVIQVERLLVSICIVHNGSYYTHVCQYVAVELHHLFYLVTERHTRQASSHFLFSMYCKMLLVTFSLLKTEGSCQSFLFVVIQENMFALFV